MNIISQQLTLSPQNNQRLAALCGQNDEYLLLIESKFDVDIKNRSHRFTIKGKKTDVLAVCEILTNLYQITDHQEFIDINEINLMIHSFKSPRTRKGKKHLEIFTKKGSVIPRTANQETYLENIMTYDLNFSVGPAGTGKTYLAVAAAVHALDKDLIKRLVLVRPAVEAGEKLGFLPGNLSQKVDPYLRPLYDALYEMLGFEQVEKYLQKNIIEIAPLAYMRGRTLNNAFIILDESQNTTKEQMKMFLTRIGFGSKAVVTGDITQIDLAHGKTSGLLHIIEVLENISGISFTFFNSKDVVRHPLVQTIIEAYEDFEK